jgi:hypothetical protein
MNDGKYRLGLVKKSNGEAIPDDEPVFILRARDHNAVAALLLYKDVCIEDGCNDYQMDGVNLAIKLFGDFANQHPDKMKQPGITRGV